MSYADVPRSGRCAGLSLRVALGLLVFAAATRAQSQEWQAALRSGDYLGARAALERELIAEPENTSLRYQLARVLGLLGSNEAALAEFDALLARYPNDADDLLGRAQALARLGRDAEAIATAERASRLAPDYEDVWHLRLTLAERSADQTQTAALRREIAERFPDAQWWRRTPAPAEHVRWVSMGWGRDRLSNGAPDWTQQYVRLDWQKAAASFYGSVSSTSRFDRNDSSFDIGGTWKVLPAWRIGGALAVTSDAEFEPDQEESVNAQRSWADGWGAELQYRRREYSSALVSTYSFGGDRYISDFRVAYRLDYSILHGSETSTSHSFVFDWYPTETRTLGVTLSAGEEIETVDLDQLLRTRVSSVTLNGREKLSPRVALNWWIGGHQQGDFYRRRYGGIAVRIGI